MELLFGDLPINQAKVVLKEGWPLVRVPLVPGNGKGEVSGGKKTVLTEWSPRSGVD